MRLPWTSSSPMELDEAVCRAAVARRDDPAAAQSPSIAIRAETRVFGSGSPVVLLGSGLLGADGWGGVPSVLAKTGARDMQKFVASLYGTIIRDAHVDQFRCLLGDCAEGRSPRKAPQWAQWVKYRNSLRALHTIGDYDDDPAQLRSLSVWINSTRPSPRRSFSSNRFGRRKTRASRLLWQRGLKYLNLP